MFRCWIVSDWVNHLGTVKLVLDCAQQQPGCCECTLMAVLTPSSAIAGPRWARKSLAYDTKLPMTRRKYSKQQTKQTEWPAKEHSNTHRLSSLTSATIDMHGHAEAGCRALMFSEHERRIGVPHGTLEPQLLHMANKWNSVFRFYC